MAQLIGSGANQVPVNGMLGTAAFMDASAFVASIGDATTPAIKPTYTKSEVGLGNVDNTSDANKPVSTATQTALDTKVDKVAGKQLSTEDYTTAEKSKLSGVAAGANNYSHPEGDGNQHVPATGTTNNGKVLKAGSTAGSVAWGNVDYSEVTGLQSALDGKEPTIAAGTATQYWRGDKTWRDFFTDVRAATLAGLSTATNAVVAATDTVLAAIGKLQAQVSAKFDKTGGDVDGNINITGTGRRITGDFSNGTHTNRLLFQTSTPNGNTAVGAIPNGTGNIASFVAWSGSDASNASYAQIVATATDTRLISSATGTGTSLPMTFWTGGAERMRIDTSGNVLVTNAAGLGYGVGSGGTVVQATSKSTAVTLNKPTGQITMNNAALGAGASVTFDLNNTLISINDTLIVNQAAGTTVNYTLSAVCDKNTAYITVINRSGGSLSEAIKINFAIIKGAIS